jgi:hypothetical protein
MTSPFVIRSKSVGLSIASQVGRIAKVAPVVAVAGILFGSAAVVGMGAHALTSRVVTALTFSEKTANITGIAVGILTGTATVCVIWSYLFIAALLNELKRM